MSDTLFQNVQLQAAKPGEVEIAKLATEVLKGRNFTVLAPEVERFSLLQKLKAPIPLGESRLGPAVLSTKDGFRIVESGPESVDKFSAELKKKLNVVPGSTVLTRNEITFSKDGLLLEFLKDVQGIRTVIYSATNPVTIKSVEDEKRTIQRVRQILEDAKSNPDRYPQPTQKQTPLVPSSGKA